MRFTHALKTAASHWLRVALDREASYPLAPLSGYFLLAVLGFSFWFFIAVPFASHRETYVWLAGAINETASEQFRFGVSSTYRPLPQIVIWSLFRVLDPTVFPTSPLRQALLQGTVYGCFVFAWWLIYSAALQRRVFAVLACVTGAFMFSGYVHLFHLYGMMYVPPMIMLGALLHFGTSRVSLRQEAWFAGIALLLAFWHPLATAIFLSYYFGLYVDTFRHRKAHGHALPLALLVTGALTVVAVVLVFPRGQTPMDRRLAGFLASYRTNEVGVAVSFVAFLLAEAVSLSTVASARNRVIASLACAALSAVCFLSHIPVLLVWVLFSLLKLIHLRQWRLFFLLLAATLFPLGGVTGTPIHSLFALILSTYVTALGWARAELTLSFLRPRYAAGIVVAAGLVVGLVRAGVDVPVVTRAAVPLLAERERTYQLEAVLAWLHASPHCHCRLAFADDAPSPVDSLASALTRRYRPPAAIGDARAFWDSVLRCHRGTSTVHEGELAVVTFGRRPSGSKRPVYEIRGTYGGDAIVTIEEVVQ